MVADEIVFGSGAEVGEAEEGSRGRRGEGEMKRGREEETESLRDYKRKAILLILVLVTNLSLLFRRI